MRVQTLVVVDGHSSNLTLTLLWLDEVVLVYERNNRAVLLWRQGAAPTYEQLLRDLRQWYGEIWPSGTHAAIYWLLIHIDAVPNALSVQSILEAIQEQPCPSALHWDGAAADPLAYADRGTLCTSVEHWRCGDEDYWMIYCRQGAEALGGQALCYHVQSKCAIVLWTYPFGSVETLAEMRAWLESYNGMVQASDAALNFYWMQSYGRGKLDGELLAIESIAYDCFGRASAAQRLTRYRLEPEQWLK